MQTHSSWRWFRVLSSVPVVGWFAALFFTEEINSYLYRKCFPLITMFFSLQGRAVIYTSCILIFQGSLLWILKHAFSCTEFFLCAEHCQVIKIYKISEMSLTHQKVIYNFARETRYGWGWCLNWPHSSIWFFLMNKDPNILVVVWSRNK